MQDAIEYLKELTKRKAEICHKNPISALGPRGSIMRWREMLLLGLGPPGRKGWDTKTQTYKIFGRSQPEHHFSLYEVKDEGRQNGWMVIMYVLYYSSRSSRRKTVFWLRAAGGQIFICSRFRAIHEAHKLVRMWGLWIGPGRRPATHQENCLPEKWAAKKWATEVVLSSRVGSGPKDWR